MAKNQKEPVAKQNFFNQSMKDGVSSVANETEYYTERGQYDCTCDDSKGYTDESDEQIVS